MLTLVLLESELRSLIRNSLERILGSKINKKYNKNLEILLKISIRCVASLITLSCFEYIKSVPEIRQYSSYILVFIFILFLYNEYK